MWTGVAPSMALDRSITELDRSCHLNVTSVNTGEVIFMINVRDL